MAHPGTPTKILLPDSEMPTRRYNIIADMPAPPDPPLHPVIPAPESAHAAQGAIAEALPAEAEGTPRTILFGLSGHGHFDLAAYEQYLGGRLQDYCYPAEMVERVWANLPAGPGA